MATAAFQAPPAPAPSVAAGGEQLAYTAVARVRFTTEAHAAMAARSLAVDDELQPTKAVKEFSVDGHTLVCTMRATEARVLRVMLSSFYDMAAVTLRTLRDFA